MKEKKVHRTPPHTHTHQTRTDGVPGIGHHPIIPPPTPALRCHPTLSGFLSSFPLFHFALTGPPMCSTHLTPAATSDLCQLMSLLLPVQHQVSIPPGTLERAPKLSKSHTETNHRATRLPTQTKEVFCSLFFTEQRNLSPLPVHDDIRGGSEKLSFLGPQESEPCMLIFFIKCTFIL